MKIRKFISDTILNIISSFFPIFVLQIVVYPIVAARIDSDSYGLMLSVYSFISLVSGTLGGELCNTRLIKEQSYEEKRLVGDFNIILNYYVIIVPVIVVVGTFFMEDSLSILDFILIIYISLSVMISNYLDVGLRLKLDYRSVFISKCIVSAGYIIGMLAALSFDKWQFIFIFGDTLTIIFYLFKTNLIREKCIKTQLFKTTLIDTLLLDCSGFLQRIITYADKIILYPLAGGTAVSIYYTATLFGKIISMGINPLTTVILSYLARMKGVNNKLINIFLVVSGILCIIGYFVCVWISDPVLGLLFPQWKEEAMKLVPMATIGVCVLAFCSILTPLTLKFCSMHWQMIINGSSVLVFLVLGCILLDKFGLMGFCIGINISYIMKAILLVYLFLKIPKENGQLIVKDL